MRYTDVADEIESGTSPLCSAQFNQYATSNGSRRLYLRELFRSLRRLGPLSDRKASEAKSLQQGSVVSEAALADWLVSSRSQPVPMSAAESALTNGFGITAFRIPVAAIKWAKFADL